VPKSLGHGLRRAIADQQCRRRTHHHRDRQPGLSRSLASAPVSGHAPKNTNAPRFDAEREVLFSTIGAGRAMPIHARKLRCRWSWNLKSMAAPSAINAGHTARKYTHARVLKSSPPPIAGKCGVTFKRSATVVVTRQNASPSKPPTTLMSARFIWPGRTAPWWRVGSRTRARPRRRASSHGTSSTSSTAASHSKDRCGHRCAAHRSRLALPVIRQEDDPAAVTRLLEHGRAGEHLDRAAASS
jgi:hypothetical protein